VTKEPVLSLPAVPKVEFAPAKLKQYRVEVDKSPLEVAFFPQDDQDYIVVSVERTQGTPLAVTDLSVREVEEILYTSPYVASFVTTVGASSALR
jgi:hypothetical protein